LTLPNDLPILPAIELLEIGSVYREVLQCGLTRPPITAARLGFT